MLSDKIVQVDILYEYAEYYRKHTIDAEDYETAVKLTQEFMDTIQDCKPQILDARIFIGEEKIIVRQKIIELINRRKHGKSRME